MNHTEHPKSTRKARRVPAGLAVLIAGIMAWSLAACEKEPQRTASGGEVKEIVFGMQCDRTGPTQNVGVVICEAMHHYIALFNKKQVLGEDYRIRLMEVDQGYNVPRSLEAYERQKAAGAVTMLIYGTPQTYAAAPKLEQDQIPGSSPGFGNALSADGKKFPYLFPIAASYWSQIGSVVKFIEEKWEGSKPPKIAYLHYDNPSGREPLPVLRELQEQIGFELREYAVPLPGLEMRPQVLDIVRNYEADWVITHLFGRAPSVSIKEFARVSFPRSRMISLVWGALQMDVKAAGEENSEGYLGVQFTGVGDEFPVIQEIRQMFADEGKPAPKEMDLGVLYNRGVFIAAIHARAIQLAFEKHGWPVTGQHVKEGMESIREFSLGGLVPPLTVTEEDHEGGGWVRIYQVRNGEWEPVSEWMQGYRDVVLRRVAQGG